jgi:hypothetical protein
MADPRRTSTRRAVLSYDHYKTLWKDLGISLPDLLIDDYQGILQDFIFTSDEIDIIDDRVTVLQDSHYPNMSTQVQFLQQQLNGLPEFTIDTTGFTIDTTFITTDKAIA